jgi:hypothetical protein
LEDVEGTVTFTQSVAGVEQSIEQTCDCYWIIRTFKLRPLVSLKRKQGVFLCLK